MKGLGDTSPPKAVHSEAPAKAFPKVYAVIAHGVCMEPLYKDGAALIASSTLECEVGDVVIIHFKPEFVRPGGFEAVVKRLRYPLYGMSFPWNPEGSDVVIPVTVEQLNPPQTYNFRVDTIMAVHKVIGEGARASDGSITASKAALAAAGVL